MGKTSNNDSVARILSMAALQNGQLDSDIIVKSAVGGIPAGKVYQAGTSVTTIISDMLGDGSSIVVEDVKIYSGALTDKPTTLDGLASSVVKSNLLIGTFTIKISAGDGKGIPQYPIFAVPIKYSVTKWCVDGFDQNIPYTKVVSNGYNIYYLNNSSYDVDKGGITYKINVK